MASGGQKLLRSGSKQTLRVCARAQGGDGMSETAAPAAASGADVAVRQQRRRRGTSQGSMAARCTGVASAQPESARFGLTMLLPAAASSPSPDSPAQRNQWRRHSTRLCSGVSRAQQPLLSFSFFFLVTFHWIFCHRSHRNKAGHLYKRSCPRCTVHH